MRRLSLIGICLAVLGVCTPDTVQAATDGRVVLSEVLTGTQQSASAEFIELYNAASSDIDISGWKILYFSATGTTPTTKVTLTGTLTAHTYALGVSVDFGSSGDVTFAAGLPESGGRLQLVDANGNVQDALSWGVHTTPSKGQPASAPTRGQSLVRFQDTDDNAADFMLADTPSPQSGGLYDPQPPETDICPNLSGVQLTLPAGYQKSNAGDCIAVAAACTGIEITELLPDPLGDTGNEGEFIELYNPTTQPIFLNGCKLYSGASYAQSKTLGDIELGPNQYQAFMFSETGLQLSNTSGRAKLTTADGATISESPQYTSLHEGSAWALINGSWQATKKPTPNAANELILDSTEPGKGGGSDVAELAPCPAGKYRNPLTNRCRSLETEASQLSACAADEYHNPITNRCRKTTAVATTQKPCQAGYERNPETNRCRKATNATDALVPCKPGYERNQETNRCRKAASTTAPTGSTVADHAFAIAGLPENASWLMAGALGLGVTGYGVYEWRYEAGRLWAYLRQKVSGK